MFKFDIIIVVFLFAIKYSSDKIACYELLGNDNVWVFLTYSHSHPLHAYVCVCMSAYVCVCACVCVLKYAGNIIL